MKARGPRTVATTWCTPANSGPAEREGTMARWRCGERASALALLLLALAFAAAPARGALFDDDEARKRIEAVRQRVDQIEQRLAAIEGTLKSQGLVDLLRDVEQV